MRITWAVVSALILSVLLLASPVMAIADPDTPPQINAVYVYEDCLEDGDVGVLVDIYLDYASFPDETATDAFLVAFIDTDGATQLKAVAPYTYVNSGYERNLVWTRFTAAEVMAYNITQASELDYKIWLMGNPTLDWSGDPPKTEASVDYWQTSGTTATLVALRVLYYADILELDWSVDLVEGTSQGNRLTTTGEGYFENVIPSLRDIAPACFAAGIVQPEIPDIDYTTEFGATATGTIISGSPVTMTEGENTITATGTGTFTMTLLQGTVGTVTNGTGTVTGSPVTIVAGTNTLTVTGAGTLIVDVEQSDTVTATEDVITGTGWDLTDLAAEFGMSRWMFSGIVWLVLSVVICAALYRGTGTTDYFGNGAGRTKAVMVLFDLCIIAGLLLGLLHLLVGILLFIAFGALTAYVLVFKGASF